MTDQADEAAFVVDHRQVPNVLELHHVLGKRQRLLGEEGDHGRGHEVFDQDEHHGSSLGALPRAAAYSSAWSACSLKSVATRIALGSVMLDAYSRAGPISEIGRASCRE